MTEQEKFYRGLLDSLSEGVYFVDKERRITFWNKGAERISGFKGEEVLGRFCGDGVLNHVDEQGRSLCDTDLCPAKQSIDTGQDRQAELFLHHKDGHRVPVFAQTHPIRDENGHVIGAMEAFEEIPYRLEYERQIKKLEALALVDPLTSAGNRRHGEMRIRALLGELDRYHWPFGVLFVDIDHFKAVNDTYGHEVGDRVLRMVAQTLFSNIRSFDHVSRWGGEEFVVLLVNVTEEHLGKVAEKLRALIENSALEHNSQRLCVTVSIGATLCRNGDTLETLVNRADQLMYKGKQAGRNRVRVG